MQTATVAGLGELIESYRLELLSEWHREVDLFRGAEQLDAPTITDHIPQLLTELAQHLRSDRREANLIVSPAEHGVQRWRVGFDITEIVAEYGILRTCIYRLAEKHQLPLTSHIACVVNTVFDLSLIHI